MNYRERIYRKSLALSNAITTEGQVTKKHHLQWRRLRKLIKKHKRLLSRRKTLKYRHSSEGSLPYALSYYSDRWTRCRMYRVDELFKSELV